MLEGEGRASFGELKATDAAEDVSNALLHFLEGGWRHHHGRPHATRGCMGGSLADAGGHHVRHFGAQGASLQVHAEDDLGQVRRRCDAEVGARDCPLASHGSARPLVCNVEGRRGRRLESGNGGARGPCGEGDDGVERAHLRGRVALNLKCLSKALSVDGKVHVEPVRAVTHRHVLGAHAQCGAWLQVWAKVTALEAAAVAQVAAVAEGLALPARSEVSLVCEAGPGALALEDLDLKVVRSWVGGRNAVALLPERVELGGLGRLLRNGNRVPRGLEGTAVVEEEWHSAVGRGGEGVRAGVGREGDNGDEAARSDR
mmetsp:Transcript_25890/g.69932  ORF Transcript_25890/g.69932 Transcript_25890/m.69932 type:complete len:315 (+) Transcript_25890:422-1366(+)